MEFFWVGFLSFTLAVIGGLVVLVGGYLWLKYLDKQDAKRASRRH